MDIASQQVIHLFDLDEGLPESRSGSFAAVGAGIDECCGPLLLDARLPDFEPSPALRRALEDRTHDDAALRRVWLAELEQHRGFRRLLELAARGELVLLHRRSETFWVDVVREHLGEILGRTGSLTELLASHAALRDLLSDLMERILDRDAEAIAERFSLLAEWLAAHASLEDGVLLPLFIGTPRQDRATPEMLEGEHDKIRGLLQAMVRDFAGLDTDPDRSEALGMLKQAFRLEGVLEHHFAREELYLLPALDRALPAAELAALQTRIADSEGPFRGRWAALREAAAR